MAGGLGCCCCRCTQLDAWIATQPGTISGYTPLANWAKTSDCCYSRTFLINSENITYQCRDVCVPNFTLGGFQNCHRYGAEMHISPANRIDVYLLRANFGRDSFPWNTPCGDYLGCQYILLSRLRDTATRYNTFRSTGIANCLFCNFVGQSPSTPTPDPIPCPAPVSQCCKDTPGCSATGDYFLRRLCVSASAFWWRIKQPFSNIPTGTVSFESSDVSNCYCSNGSCQWPCGFPTSSVSFDTTSQCVSFPGDVYFLSSLININCGSAPADPSFASCPSVPPFSHCFSVPTWSITF